MTRKIYVFLLLCLFSLVTFAQDADFKKAVSRFKGVTLVTAKATRIDHKAAVANDDQFSGSMVIQRPDRMNISVADGKEQLDMNGDDFTMVTRGREHKTSSKKDNQFVAFQAVLTSIINADINRLFNVPGVSISKSGDILTISMDPSVGQEKKKRMMFSSFVVTLDIKKGELRTLRMNGRGKNYTEYTFSDFVFKK